jgi:ABC-type dipeptide/oligopeptide/nickel transport system permease component
MKTLKLAMVAAILSLALVSYAGIKPNPTAKKVVKISLRLAQTNPALVKSMCAQLTFSQLKAVPKGPYVGLVQHREVIFRIYGTRTQWVRFFLTTTIKVGPKGTLR